MKDLLNKGRALFLAYDQGFEHGPRDFNMDNSNPQMIIDVANSADFTGLILLPGSAEKYYHSGTSEKPLIVKLNSKTSFNKTEPISTQHCSVRRAAKMNATAVGYTLYPGSLREQEMYREFGRIVEEAHEVGMSAIAWAYPRGSGVENDLDTDTIAYGARIAAELGADMVKLKYNDDREGFPWVIRNACKSHVLVSGGHKTDSLKELEIAKEVLELGATGIAIGRNVWQSSNPKGMAKALSDVVFRKKNPADVYNKYMKE